MIRWFLVVLILACAAATPAHGAVRPLAAVDFGLKGEDGSRIALAGDTVLFVRTTSKGIRVYAVPVAGGPARRVFSAPGGDAYIVASPQRAVISVTDGFSDTTFSGPPGGPYTEIGEWLFPLQVDGDRVFTGVDGGARLLFPQRQDIPLEARDSVRFAGDYVAYAKRAPGDEPPHTSRLVVRDWRSGEVVRQTDLPEAITAIELRADGRTLASTYSGTFDVVPGAAPRQLDTDYVTEGSWIRFAGEELLTLTAPTTLEVIDPAGRRRRFGIPSEGIEDWMTDGQRVAWAANGCVLIAELSDPPADEPGPGPCLRSELHVSDEPHIHGRRTVPLELRCVSAPARRCAGTLRVFDRSRSASASRRFSVPAGAIRRMKLPLTRRVSSDPERPPTLRIRFADGSRRNYFLAG